MKLEVKHRQSLIATTAMQQAFLVLQLPIVELASWIKLQIEQNPIIHYEEDRGESEVASTALEVDFETRAFEVLDELDDAFKEALFPDYLPSDSIQEPDHPSLPSLFDHLMHQAKEAFPLASDLKKAEEIIGNLDNRGYLEDIEGVDPDILKVIQSFDPPGIAARNLQDSLLIQLRLKGRETSVAYHIIASHFEDLQQNRLPELARKLKMLVSQIQPLLSREGLNFSPTDRFLAPQTPPVIPDVFLKKVGDIWHIAVNETYLPRFTLEPPPDLLLDESERTFVRAHMTQGKWLLRTLQRRHETLKKITQALLKKQRGFFEGEKGGLTPLTFHEVATALSLHESTVARAVSDKYLSTPQGIFSLRSFFSGGLETPCGKKISTRTARERIAELVAGENKRHPLSDDELATSLAKQGIPCARRTVTKYRKNLRIPTASQRRSWN